MSKTLVGVHWSSLRFSDAFQDAYSTDFELPMTAKNMRLLDVFSVLSRRGDPYASMVACCVVIDGLSSDGLISVDGVSGELIRCTVYFAQLPTALSEPVTRIVTDNADTIVDFTDRTLEGESSRVGDVNYTLYQTAGNIIRPNVKLSYLLSRLTAATGINLPSVPDTLRIIGTRQVVCPHNTVQVLDLNWGDTSGEWLRTGQHITNEVGSEGVTVQQNRPARVEISAWVHTAIISGSAIVALQASEDGSTWTTRPLQSGGVGTTTHTTLQMTMTSQTKWRIQCSGWQGRIVLVCRWSNYAITDNDYDVPLVFDRDADYSLPSWVDEDASFVYYGVLANLPTFTARELLSSLAWMMGKRIRVTPFAVELVDADVSKSIEARIDSVEFGCDKLGRTIKIESANGETLASASIDSSKLQDTATLHKSIFARLQGVSAWNIVNVDFYSNNGDGWAAQDYNGGVALAVLTAHSSGTLYLQPWGEWSMLGIDTLRRVAMIDAVTLDEISGCDYVYIDGHKYMLIEGDRDEETGLINFKALII